jgi:hypothetical protein
MTIQPVRLSLWHLWDMQADAEGMNPEGLSPDGISSDGISSDGISSDGISSDGIADRPTPRDITGVADSVWLSGPEIGPDRLNNRLDLFVDWPIPEAGFVAGRGAGARSGDRGTLSAPLALSWGEGRADRASEGAEVFVGALPSEPQTQSLSAPSSPTFGWNLSGMGNAVQAFQDLRGGVQGRSIDSLRQLPTVVQSLQDQSRQAVSTYGPTVQDWTDRLGTHPWSKPALLLALPWGTAAVAFQALAGVPGQGTCSFNPLPLSDLDQLHCAREQMRSQDPTVVIQGFRQMRSWSKEQMLYPVAERQLQSWAAVLLGLARHQFDQGHWQDAEALLAEIPESSALHGEAQAQRTAWLRVRRQGEDLLAQAHQAIATQRWQAARTYAQQLSGLSNDYWRRQGLETLPGQIDRQAQLPQSPVTPLALGSMPWIPVRGVNPEFSPEISPKGAIA